MVSFKAMGELTKESQTSKRIDKQASDDLHTQQGPRGPRSADVSQTTEKGYQPIPIAQADKIWTTHAHGREGGGMIKMCSQRNLGASSRVTG